jgi:hypothetical protein
VDTLLDDTAIAAAGAAAVPTARWRVHPAMDAIAGGKEDQGAIAAEVGLEGIVNAMHEATQCNAMQCNAMHEVEVLGYSGDRSLRISRGNRGLSKGRMEGFKGDPIPSARIGAGWITGLREAPLRAAGLPGKLQPYLAARICALPGRRSDWA